MNIHQRRMQNAWCIRHTRDARIALDHLSLLDTLLIPPVNLIIKTDKKKSQIVSCYNITRIHTEVFLIQNAANVHPAQTIQYNNTHPNRCHCIAAFHSTQSLFAAIVSMKLCSALSFLYHLPNPSFLLLTLLTHCPAASSPRPKPFDPLKLVRYQALVRLVPH